MYFPTFILGASFLGVAKAFTMSSPYDLTSVTLTASFGTSPCVETPSLSLTLVASNLTAPLNHATMSKDPRPTTGLTLNLTAPLNHATMSKDPRPTTSLKLNLTAPLNHATISKDPRPTQTSHTNPATTAQPAETSGAAEEEEHEKPWADGVKKNLPALIAGVVIFFLALLLVVYMLIKSRCSRARDNRPREEV